jgi:hypothetical protein
MLSFSCGMNLESIDRSMHDHPFFEGMNEGMNEGIDSQHYRSVLIEYKKIETKKPSSYFFVFLYTLNIIFIPHNE